MAPINIRQSQIAHTYATGSLGDFPGVSAMFLTHDHEEHDWGKPEDELIEIAKSTKRRIISDKRLSTAFGVEYFVLPPLEGLGTNSLKVVRFPMSLYCPSCGRIHIISELENSERGYIPNLRGKTFDEMLRAYYCLDCQKTKNKGEKKRKTRYIELVPTRFIIANEEGFIDDFPWDWYVHRKAELRNHRGKGFKLFLEFGSSSASLGSISIISKDTNGSIIARENLGDIFNQESTFINQGDEYLPYVGNKMPKPWLGRNGNEFEKKLIGDVPPPEQIIRNYDGEIIGNNRGKVLRKYPRTLQRGANNLFFPIVFKGIRLPSGTNELDQRLINKISEDKSLLIKNSPDEYGNYSNQQWIDHFMGAYGYIPFYQKLNKNDFLRILQQLFVETENIINDKKQKLRLEEFNCYSNNGVTDSKEIWYKARHIKIDDNYLINDVKLEKITLLDKINELKIFRGFTRIRPIANEDLIFETDHDSIEGSRLDELARICDARKFPVKTNELPCAEVKGEGIFLKFNNEALFAWERKNSVQIRFNSMAQNLINYFNTFNIENGIEKLNARYVFLHTLSHIIMQQLSNDSGYSLSSLTEIIYCSKSSENEQMNGILIYTSSSDTEGTLGGLVEKGDPIRLTPIISKAIDKAKWCSSDPLCITSSGQGFMTTNMAACYSCVMVPETCCENINKFLDRKLVLDFFNIETL